MCYWRGVGRAGVSTEQGQWRSRGATALTRKEDVRCCAMWLMGDPTEWAVAVGWVGGGGSSGAVGRGRTLVDTRLRIARRLHRWGCVNGGGCKRII